MEKLLMEMQMLGVGIVISDYALAMTGWKGKSEALGFLNEKDEVTDLLIHDHVDGIMGLCFICEQELSAH